MPTFEIRKIPISAHDRTTILSTQANCVRFGAV